MDFKGIYLSKALTCMKLFLFKQKLLFYQEDGHLWPHCCMNNLYISHRSLYAPTYSFGQLAACLSVFLELLPGLIRKVIYVRCINCSYNIVAKGIHLLDKKAIFV